NKKSIAFKLTFVDLNKTLTDEEVMEVFNRIIDKVEEVHKAKVRDN
ncbi:MAG: phenylalanyl-tRNA synthetase subunit beta, partial [Bacilli bacterium]|nr:phenylalanyl-tRNA synthetase subunit beta [Bacilli bacterium]